MSIFKKAQNAVAHNTTFSTFGSSNLKYVCRTDLPRHLQELIKAEKAFVASQGKAAHETQKSADALRAWGASEYDDLADVLPKVALLFERFGQIQQTLNTHVTTMRMHLKSIRLREEQFADMKSRKRTLASKIEAVERRLAKMGPENKELAKVTSNLREMRADMDTLRHEVEYEDAALGDFKRQTITTALSTKSGGIMELGEKSIVIAETCRLLSEELPTTATVAGQPRAPYRNEARTERLIHEAMRQLDSIHVQVPAEGETLSRDYSSPTLPSSREPQSESLLAAVDTEPRATRAADTRARMSNEAALAEDSSHGSQGWVAPGHGASAPEEPAAKGLHTVMEGDDTQEYGEQGYAEPYEDRMYVNEEISRAELYDRQYDGHRPRVDTGRYPAPVEEEPEEYGVPSPYDMGYGYPTDAIPSFPPVAPMGSGYASHTPNSRGSPVYDGEPNRAYFEGVGSTKALQAAAARTGNFPVLDHLDMNRTPGMFATDEANGRNLSPSALRPLGPAASRLGEKPSYQNLAAVADRNGTSSTEPYAMRITPGPAAAQTLNGASVPSPSASAPPTNAMPYREATSAPITAPAEATSPVPAAAPAFATSLPYGASAASAPSSTPWSAGGEPVQTAPYSPPMPTAAPASTSSYPASTPVPAGSGAAPAVQVGAYLPYVAGTL